MFIQHFTSSIPVLIGPLFKAKQNFSNEKGDLNVISKRVCDLLKRTLRSRKTAAQSFSTSSETS